MLCIFYHNLKTAPNKQTNSCALRQQIVKIEIDVYFLGTKGPG